MKRKDKGVAVVLDATPWIADRAHGGEGRAAGCCHNAPGASWFLSSKGVRSTAERRKVGRVARPSNQSRYDLRELCLKEPEKHVAETKRQIHTRRYLPFTTQCRS